MVEIRELDIDPNTLQGSHIPGMRILAPVIVILLLIQVHKVEGALTISKDVYGPLGGSTTLQCKNTTTVSGVVSWFKTGNPINVVGSKYSQVTIPGGLGYNLTISDLQPSDAGNYHCEIGIDAASAVYLPIQYRPGNSDINSDDTGDVITIKSYPNPTFTVVANNGSGPQTLNGTESTHDNADNTKTTTWRKVTSLSPGVYTFNVTVSAPGSTTKQFNITIYASTSTSLPTTTTIATTTNITTNTTATAKEKTKEKEENAQLTVIIAASAGGGSVLIVTTTIGIILYRKRKNNNNQDTTNVTAVGGESASPANQTITSPEQSDSVSESNLNIELEPNKGLTTVPIQSSNHHTSNQTSTSHQKETNLNNQNIAN